MDIKEKLIELLTDNLPRIGNLPKCDNPLQYTMDEIVERIADHLISHGVTVQEWISVKDRLPEKDGIYIICDCRLNENPWIHTAGFIKASSSWCELHGVIYDDGYGRYSEQDKITHWMPLPLKPEVKND